MRELTSSVILLGNTPEQKQEDREVALKGPGLIEGINGEAQMTIDDWSSVIVRGDAISYIKVSYVPEGTPDVEEPRAAPEPPAPLGP
jgi:hypothetical protein